jgi:predicted permease
VISARFVSPNYFSLLGVRFVVGRAFDRAQGDVDDVVVGHSFWRGHFGGADPVGRIIRLGTRGYRVIGVAPAGFSGIDRERVDVWLHFGRAPTSGGGYWRGTGLWLLARLPDNMPLSRAESQLRAIYPADAPIVAIDGGGPSAVSLRPIHQEFRSRIRQLNPVLVYLLGAASLLLLVVCANVSALLVNRALSRRHDMAIRMQLGATRLRLVGDVLSEVALLNVLAGCLAVLMLRAIALLLQGLVTAPIPGMWVGSAFSAALYQIERLPDDYSVWNLRLFAAMIGVVVLVTMASSLAPCLYVLRTDLGRGLHARMAGEVVHTRVRNILLSCQVAVTLVLLVGAGLFVRSFQAALDVDFGVNVDDIVMASVDQNDSDLGADRPSALHAMADHIRALPEVMQVGLSHAPPIGLVGHLYVAYDVPGRADVSGPEARAFVEAVSPSYFSLLGLRLVKGRFFDETDGSASPLVVIVNERFARNVFRGDDPLDQCLEFFFDMAHPDQMRAHKCRRIVGVVSSVRNTVARVAGRDTNETDSALYVPMAQWMDPRYLLIRTTTAPGASIGLIRARLQEVAPPGAQLKVEPLALYRDQQVHAWRVASGLLAVLSTLALILSSVGTYSTIAYVLGQKRVEIGTRLAIGASSSDILRMATAMGMVPIAVGVVCGLGGSLALSRLIGALLFGVSSLDLTAVVGAIMLTIVAGLAACLIAAASAVTSSPASLLRVH